MLDEVVAHYTELLDHLGEDMAYTVTIPDSGILAIDEAVRRMGFGTVELRGPSEPHSGADLSLYQVGAGIVTLNWSFPLPEHKQVTDRLGGEGFRHWYVAFDINGGTTMYVRYGNTEGNLEHPEPLDLPFTPWTDLLGPLAGYADLLTSAYDSEEGEATVDIVAACLTVVELESGIRLDEELMHGPHSVLPMPTPEFD
ncbi:hypothetical protein AB0K60_32145 [Thermopolyspora sp. NPDC052614]|uniref:hypothetical protein n=1 Tax=Thermopolyspora sp. NPDC052614 TaxID=3155682 RepID=UPI0034236E09